MDRKTKDKKEAEIVNIRRFENLREISELKASLQSLINEAMQQTEKNEKRKALQENKDLDNKNNIQQSLKPITLRRNLSVELAVTQRDRSRSRETNNQVETTKQESSKKKKNYNVEEAREYIKKQKEKRLEDIKKATTNPALKIDIKKQKLQELHEKSLLLVNKNVEAKRARSKSRDNQPGTEYLRPDNTSAKGVRDRSKSRDNCKSGNIVTKGTTLNEKLQLFDPVNSRAKSTETNLGKRESRTTVRRSKNPLLPAASKENNLKVPSIKVVDSLECPKINIISNVTLRSPDNAQNSRIDANITKRSPRNIADCSNNSNHILSEKNRLLKENLSTRLETQYEKSIFVNNIQEYFKSKSEVAVGTDLFPMETKETQTLEDIVACPDWLQGSESKEYPYNFINTVKRKLHYALNPPITTHYNDVGIQSSFKCDLKEKEVVNQKDHVHNKPSHSDLKSFISHKCINLDSKPVEHLGLQLGNKNRFIHSKTTTITTDSESDTSKNIPDISSESGTSLRKNAESVKLTNNISENLQSLKLPKANLEMMKSDISKKTPTRSVIQPSGRSRASKTLFGSKNSYTSDYNTESETEDSVQEVILKSSRSPRDSIISGNICSYSKLDSKLSNYSNEKHTIPEDVTSTKSESSKHSRHSQHSQSSNNIPTLPDHQFKSLPTRSFSSSNIICTSIEKQASCDIPEKPENPEYSLLKEPQVSLKIGKHSISTDKIIKADVGNLNNTNQIHLKFEAEIHLLNDFNKSVNQLSALERAFESLKSKNDPQSVENDSISLIKTNEQPPIFKIPKSKTPKIKNNISQINFSRGSDVSSGDTQIDTTISKDMENSIFSGLEMNKYSSINETATESPIEMSVIENFDIMNPFGMSLKLFEQLIKEEDARLNNLKTMLKIREKSLRDRLITELSALEVQRRTLYQTGRAEEASVIKKKQRGILIKHEEERHEMQRLKQLQNTKSKERISKLQEERNLIKAQLSTDKVLSKIKVNSTPREKRKHSGPLRVVSHSESVVSEMSVSRRSSTMEDLVSVSSRSHSVTSIMSEIEHNMVDEREKKKSDLHVSQIKRFLLMKEVGLEKRRKEAKSLLQWHKKLVEEEKRIAALESSAKMVISQLPKAKDKKQTAFSADEVKYEFKGSLLKQLWFTITGSETKEYIDNRIYLMSEAAFKKFNQKATDLAQKTKLARKDSVVELNLSDLTSFSIPNDDSASASEKNKSVITKHEQKYNNVPESVNSTYSTDFDVESIKEIASVKEPVPENNTISSISDLIKNFTIIGEEMSVMSRESQKLLNDSNILLNELDEIEEKSNQTSVISEKLNTETEEKITENYKKIQKQSSGSEIDTKSSGEKLEKDLSITEEEHKIINLVSQSSTESQKNYKDLTITEEEQKILNLVTQSSTESQINNKDLTITEEEQKILNLVTQPSTESEINTKSSSNKSQKVTTEPSLSSKTSLKSNIEEILDVSQKIDDILAKHVASNSSQSESEYSKLEELSYGALEQKAKDSTSEISSNKKSEKTENEVSADLKSKEIGSIEEKEQDSLSDKSPSEKIHSSETPEKSQPQVKISDLVLENKSEVFSEGTTSNIESILNEIQSTNVEIEISQKALSPIIDDNHSEKEVSEVSSQGTSEDSKILDSDKEISVEEDKSEVLTVMSSKSKVKESVKEESTAKSNIFIEKTIKSDLLPTENKETSPKSFKTATPLTSESISKTKSPKSQQSSEIASEVSYSSFEKSPTSLRSSENKSPKGFDVKKRVSEIMADANPNRGDKSPRMQDLYVTTYDVVSPSNSPELRSSSDEELKSLTPTKNFGSEAEELLRKQLAIEQEIKQLEQQQKEIPYVFVREIPNKPPPPYTPPSSSQVVPVKTILPTSAEEIDEITKYSAKIIHKAYLNNNLENISISENTLSLINKNKITTNCYKFVFDICKEIAKNHYKQFEKEDGPSWLIVAKKPLVAPIKPLDVNGLETLMSNKLKELFNYKKLNVRENTIMKWSRKKRDHVDEILMLETQAEEVDWTYYDKDELIVIDRVTNDIMNTLLADTVNVFRQMLLKKTHLY
ncbi:unnamed protein product [Brassicogethes aeneus]|uniref:Centrosome-associated protein 350-like n=1 Tax=Brassicogethes aeneus TaxID=1431903 RepID=A0A9P0FBB4_BRAAE|nr:unnamed protein product [Brassicogethes aeneus]